MSGDKVGKNGDWELLRETDKYIIEGRPDRFMIRYTKIEGSDTIETSASSLVGYKQLLKTFEKGSNEEVDLLTDTVYIAKSLGLGVEKIGVESEAEVVG